MKTKNTTTIFALLLFMLSAGLSYSTELDKLGPWKGKIRSYGFDNKYTTLQPSWYLSVSSYSKDRNLSISFIISGCKEGLLGRHSLLERQAIENCVRSPNIPFSFIIRENGNRKKFVPISGDMNIYLEKKSGNYNYIVFDINSNLKEVSNEKKTININALVVLKLNMSDEKYHIMMPNVSNQNEPSKRIDRNVSNPSAGDLVDDNTGKETIRK